MRNVWLNARRFVAAFVTLPLLAGAAIAADVRVVSSGGFAPAYKVLAPDFERASGHRLITEWGPSMGETANAIPNRLLRGEAIDVVVMVGRALDDLVKQGKVLGDSKVVLARSRIGMAVRSGATKPDIGTVEALKRTLLDAKSIAYSDSASGVYLSKVLFPKLGIAEQLKDKARMIPAEPVGKVVARGDAEIGFQQVSELKAVAGIDVVGVLPAEVEEVTLFSAGVVSAAKEPEAGRALIKFLSSAAAASAIEQSGLEAASDNSKQIFGERK
jgi:molybdate transport system substrate-binding protein